MAMMDVWIVLVRMSQYAMQVRMDVRFGSIPSKIMLMLVMSIVPVCVSMAHRFMRMIVLMRFGQVQPDACTH